MKEKKYHYFYKITNKINGKFYYGVHNTNNLDDSYWGSGIRITAAIKKYGVENFEKEIIKQFDTWEEAFAYEELIVTEDLINDPNCYNVQKGGRTGGVEAIDRRHKEIFKDHQKGEKNSQYGTVWITKDDENKKIKRSELDIYLAAGWEKGRFIEKFGRNKRIVGIYKDNEYLQIPKNELKEYLDAGWTLNTRNNSVSQKGSRNSQYCTKWVHKNSEQLKIKEDLLEQYINDGWELGPLKYKWVNNGKVNTRVSELDFNKYLTEGWIAGKLKKSK